MKETYNKLFSKYNGKPCEVNDPSNLNQCFDLAYAFCDVLGVTRDTIRHLYASEIYTKPNDLTVKYFELVPNTAMFVPKVGDICVFKGGVAGHVSIATGEGDTNTFKSFDQNWNTTSDDQNNKCVVITHSYDNLLGVLRFRMPTAPAEITDQTILPIKDENNNFMEVQAVRGRMGEYQILKNTVEAMKADIVELRKCGNELLDIKIRAREITFGKGWTWTKINALKKLLA